MLKALLITLLLSTSPTAQPEITTADINNIEHITIYEAGISIEYNEDYCINNNLDYRGYWIEFDSQNNIVLIETE